MGVVSTHTDLSARALTWSKALSTSSLSIDELRLRRWLGELCFPEGADGGGVAFLVRVP